MLRRNRDLTEREFGVALQRNAITLGHLPGFDHVGHGVHVHAPANLTRRGLLMRLVREQHRAQRQQVAL